MAFGGKAVDRLLQDRTIVPEKLERGIPIVPLKDGSYPARQAFPERFAASFVVFICEHAVMFDVKWDIIN